MSYVANSAKFTLVQNPYDQHTGLGRGGEAKEVVKSRTLAAGNVSSRGNTVTFSIPTTELGDYAGYAKLTYQTAVKRGELDTSTNEVKFTNSARAESGSKKLTMAVVLSSLRTTSSRRPANRSTIVIASNTPFSLTSQLSILRVTLVSSSWSIPWMPSARWCRRRLRSMSA